MLTNDLHTLRPLAPLAVLVFSLLTGCQQYSAVGDTPAELELDALKAEMAENEATPVPDVIDQALMRSSSGASQARAQQERFDIAVHNVPARAFFLGLIADAGVNVVAHPDVEGSISLELTDVTVDQVLDVTREIYGYEYKHENDIYTIYPRKIRTETFPINYIDIQRVGVSDTSVQVGKIGADSGRNNNRAGGSNTVQDESANLLSMLGGETTDTGGSEGITPGSRVQTVTSTNFWGMLEETLNAIVGQGEGRMVMVSPQASMAVVKAMPRELSEVRDFLERAQLSVKRQVILEAKILEVRLSEGYQSGIDWGNIQGQLLLTDNVTSFEIPTNITGASNAAGQVFSSIFRVADISDLVSLLETQGSVQVLSSPRVSTVNNQKAVIRVGSDEFFVTGISSQQTSSLTTTSTTPNIELSSFFSGISLDVTPQISKNGDVLLHVHPIISEVSDQLKQFTVGDEEFALPLALREIRESDSIVRAQSGEVIVLGGLMQESFSVQDGQQPGLGDVPLLNRLFQTESREKTKTELVILLRPIVVEKNTWEQQILGSGSRIRDLSDEYRARY